MSLTHIDEQTGSASMVDISSKEASQRRAVAAANVHMNKETFGMIQKNALKKGDALAVARIAGIMAAKRTADLIPLCHSLPLSHVSVEFEFDADAAALKITATASTVSRTGVEMEALTAASIAALTIYDMAKSSDRAMWIDGVRLLEKTGGKSGDYRWTE